MCMDHMDIDMDHSSQPKPRSNNEPEQYQILPTTKIHNSEFTDVNRKRNLELIYNNIQQNIERIKTLPADTEPVVKRLLEIQQQTTELQRSLSLISTLALFNGKQLQEKIDTFADIEFEQAQHQLKKQVDALVAQKTPIQSNQIDDLLIALKSIQL